MKARLVWIIAIVLAVTAGLPALPVAARPKDPDSFLVTPIRQGDCVFGASVGDPRNGLCPSDLPELVTNQPRSSRPAKARSLKRNTAAAATPAGSPQYTLEMQMTTNTRGGSWTARSTGALGNGQQYRSDHDRTRRLGMK